MRKLMLVMLSVSMCGILNAGLGLFGALGDTMQDQGRVRDGTGRPKSRPSSEGAVAREDAGQTPTSHAEKEAESNPQHDSRYIREIAQVLGVGFSEGQSVANLASEIRLSIQDAEDRVPPVRPLPDDVVNALKEVLGPSDFKVVLNMNNGLKKMAEYRMLALPKKLNRK